jgi:calpain-7
MEAQAQVGSCIGVHLYCPGVIFDTEWGQHRKITDTLQAAESSVDKSLTKDAAFKSAVLAAELYMDAVKMASSDDERSRLRRKCERLLSRAEEIRAAVSWAPSSATENVLPAPRSERLITRSEEIILLEGSKLHGHIFPPWTSDPDDSEFDAGTIYS